jgi:DNA mismatch repair protein MutS
MNSFSRFFIVVSLFSFLFANSQEDQDKETFIKQVKHLNLSTFPEEYNSWSTNSTREYVEKAIAMMRTGRPRRRRGILFDVFTSFFDRGLAMENEVNTWKDLELFVGLVKKDVYVSKAIAPVHTDFGLVAACMLLSNPTTDICLLKERQAIIRVMAKNVELRECLSHKLKKMRESENDLLIFFGDHTDMFKENMKRSFFNKGKDSRLNKYSSILFGKKLYEYSINITGLSIEALSVAVLAAYCAAKVVNYNNQEFEFFAEKYKYRTPISNLYWAICKERTSQAVAAGVLCYWSKQGVYWSYDNLMGSFYVDKFIQELMCSVAKAVNNFEKIYNLLSQHISLAQTRDLVNMRKFFEEGSQELVELRHILRSNTFKKPSIFCHKGRILRAYFLMHKLKDQFKSAFCCLGLVDLYVGLSRMVDNKEFTGAGLCFPQYVEASKPVVNLKDFWHPILESKTVVTNNVHLGEEGRRNMLITGPNAGGKSTIMKSIALAIIMGQSFGVAPARSMAFTPMTYISTYTETITADLTSGNSLFKMEVKRAQDVIQAILNLQEGKFAFCLIDEMFSGTSPIEAESTAFSVAKHMGTNSASIICLATHFNLLTQLEGQTDSFRNYKVSVGKKPDGKIAYPYKLQEGISNQNVALDILKEQGFFGHIIDEASELVKKRLIESK